MTLHTRAVFVERRLPKPPGARILVDLTGDGGGNWRYYTAIASRLRGTFRLLDAGDHGRYTHSDLTYQPSSSPLQDFAYTYDLTGNILTLVDRTPRSGGERQYRRAAVPGQ